MDATEYALPADAAFAVAEPYEPGFTDDMIDRYEAPIAGVEGVVSVISHHPVIVHLKSIGVAFFTINDKLTVLLVECVALIVANDAAVKGDILWSKCNGSAFFRHCERAEIVAVPFEIGGVEREYPVAGI